MRSAPASTTSTTPGPPELALRVDVPWERGHKRELRLDTAGYQRRIAEQKLADSIRRLTLDVTLACIDVHGGQGQAGAGE